jgi:hypothetical protein
MSTDTHRRPDIPIPNDAGVDRLDADAYTAWHRALKGLTGDQQRFDAWRKQRYAFAPRRDFVDRSTSTDSCRDRTSALGVYLAGTGLCYVGQTQEGFGTSLSEKVTTWP